MHLLLALVVLCLVSAPAAAQCCGDCNGDGEVTINELITAVNNALNGCPASGTCPIDFSDDNFEPGTPDCYYRGRWNQSCGDGALEAIWRSDGEFLIVQLLDFDQGIYFGAEVTTAGSAEIFCWYVEDDASDCEANPLGGAIALAGGGGMLTIDPDAVPFSIDGCDFVRYAGALVEVATPAAAGAARVLPPPPATALQRLRDMGKRAPARRDFRRR